MPIDTRCFFSLDRQSEFLSKYAEPDRYSFLEKFPKTGRFIPRGSGLSYVAASFGKDSVSVGFGKFSRILEFNADAKAPMITVEAGITLHALHIFLCPRGLRVPVEPGHPQISIGGCIAFNVFGKNQFKEGLFESCVEELEVFHPQKGVLKCSRAENKELFDLTIGGMGLTGVILKAKLRLARIPSPWLRVRNISFRNLQHMVEVLQQVNDSADALNTFNDFSVFGKNMGQGFVTVSNFSDEHTPAKLLESFHSLDRRPTQRFSYFNALSIPVFGFAYRTWHTKFKSEEKMPFYQFNYPVAGISFYFDWYGKKGFIERQILVPEASVEKYIEKFERLLRSYRPQVVLGSCKFFSGKQRLLHFAGRGLVISIDVVPHTGKAGFHEALDALNVDMGAIDNIAKDSRISRELIRREYPDYEKVRERMAAYDPNRQFASALSQKLSV